MSKLDVNCQDLGDIDVSVARNIDEEIGNGLNELLQVCRNWLTTRCKANQWTGKL